MIPEFGHDDFEDGYEEEGYDAEEACQSLLERKFSDWDYPDEIEFLTQDEKGLCQNVAINVQMEPIFTSKTLTVGVKQKRI